MTAIGVLGEDATDCKTISVILRRIIPKEVGVQRRAPPKGGCAALRRAAEAYMKDLVRGGCSAIVLVHDLDLDAANSQLNCEPTLRAHLNTIAVPSGAERLICIPVEELEAWFWADQVVLDKVGRGHGKAERWPQQHVRKPKEALRNLSAKAHHKPVYSTNDNHELAEILNLELCAERCPSFRDLLLFARRTCGQLADESLPPSLK